MRQAGQQVLGSQPELTREGLPAAPLRGGGTLGHPWGNAAGAAANRVALEACVAARNSGRELEREGKEILTQAARSSPELRTAMETWKEIKFEFDTVDKLDVAHR